MTLKQWKKITGTEKKFKISDMSLPKMIYDFKENKICGFYFHISNHHKLLLYVLATAI